MPPVGPEFLVTVLPTRVTDDPASSVMPPAHQNHELLLAITHRSNRAVVALQAHRSEIRGEEQVYELGEHAG